MTVTVNKIIVAIVKVWNLAFLQYPIIMHVLYENYHLQSSNEGNLPLL